MLCPVNRAGSYQDCFRGFGENQVQWTGAKVGIILWSYFSICPGFFFCSNPKKRNYSRLEIMTVGKACTQGYIPTPGVTSGQVICTFEKSRSRSRKKWPTVVASLMLCSVQYCLLSCWACNAYCLNLSTHCDLTSRPRSSKWAYRASISLPPCQVWM